MSQPCNPDPNESTRVYRPAHIALPWLLHYSDAAAELRRRVSQVVARIHVEGPTEYLDDAIHEAEWTPVSEFPGIHGWQAAAALAWNSLDSGDREVLALRHLAHGLADGPGAERWWWSLVQHHGNEHLINRLSTATLKFAVEYDRSIKQEAAR